MFLQLLFSNPAVLVVWISVILIAITVHEFSHALVADRLGDKTADAAGRLTLNPLRHVDPMGLIFLFLLGFGWAKPVPFNPYNLRDPKRDAVYIALAGPFSNLLLAGLAGGTLQVLRMMDMLPEASLLVLFLVLTILINLFLLFFNVLPIPPLDGSKLVDALLTKPEHQKIREAIFRYGPQVLLLLIVVSILTNFNVFFFVTGPAYYLCDLIAGQSCGTVLFSVLR